MADFEIKANDTLPIIEATLGFLASPTADADLATVLGTVGTTVDFIMRLDGEPTPKVNSPAEITDAPNRKVRYVWATGDTDTPSTTEYNAEWEVTHPDGKVQTFPTSGYTTVLINADLDEAP